MFCTVQGLLGAWSHMGRTAGGWALCQGSPPYAGLMAYASKTPHQRMP